MFKTSIPCCYFPTKVIIIDDNPDFSDHLLLAFGADFQCDAFTSPKEALAYLKQQGDAVKALFAKHISMSPDQTSLSSLSIDVDVASVCREIYSQAVRFDRPVVLIVDYSMPEMNGLEFCQQLSDLPYQKIILTGEADNDFAVDAFNQTNIQRFVKKEDYNCFEKLTDYVQELNIEYFTQLSQSMFDMLGANEPNRKSLLCSEAFIDLFNRIIAKHNIVEFYLIDNSGSYLLLDSKGNRFELIVRTEEDMRSFQELAEDEGLHAMAESIANRKKMPHMLVWQDRLCPASDWILHDVTLLQNADDNYFYALLKDTDSAANDNLAKQMPISYEAHLRTI